jgi:hypothetical protein
MNFLSDQIITARKDYKCNACNILKEFFGMNGRTYTGFTFSELRQIIQAKREGWKILKGQKYRKYIIKYDGQLYVNRERPEITAILTKYQLWPEE